MDNVRIVNLNGVDYYEIGGNYWAVNSYSKERAFSLSKTLINCKGCFNCSNCIGLRNLSCRSYEIGDKPISDNNNNISDNPISDNNNNISDNPISDNNNNISDETISDAEWEYEDTVKKILLDGFRILGFEYLKESYKHLSFKDNVYTASLGILVHPDLSLSTIKHKLNNDLESFVNRWKHYINTEGHVCVDIVSSDDSVDGNLGILVSNGHGYPTERSLKNYTDRHIPLFFKVRMSFIDMEIVIMDGVSYYSYGDNYWSVNKYTKMEVIELSKTLINCQGCVDCRDLESCINCFDSTRLKNCIRCSECSDCEYSMMLLKCTKTYYCKLLIDSHGVRNDIRKHSGFISHPISSEVKSQRDELGEIDFYYDKTKGFGVIHTLPRIETIDRMKEFIVGHLTHNGFRVVRYEQVFCFNEFNTALVTLSLSDEQTLGQIRGMSFLLFVPDVSPVGLSKYAEVDFDEMWVLGEECDNALWVDFNRMEVSMVVASLNDRR